MEKPTENELEAQGYMDFKNNELINQQKERLLYEVAIKLFGIDYVKANFLQFYNSQSKTDF